MQEYENEYCEDDTHSKLTKYIIPYFFFLAVLMWPATALHWGMMGILFGMAIAAALLGGCVLLFKYIRKKMSHVHLTRRQWVEMMTGVPAAPSQVVEATGQMVVGEAEEEIGEAPLATRTLATLASVALTAQGLPDRIIEDNGLYLSDHFMPDINTLFGQVAVIFGIRGYGKSNLISVLCEEMAPYHLPMLIVDTKDQYSPLADRVYLPRGWRAGSPDLAAVNKPEHYVQLRTCDAYTFGKQIMEHCFQVVLNMASYETKDEAALVLCEIIRGMDDWAQERPNGERIPVEVVVDEAGTWLPQDGNQSEVAKTTQHYLNRTFFGTMVNRGRSNGWGLILANQRVQGINKSVLQAPWKFLFYQTQKVDLEQYATFGLRPEQIMALQVSECFIFSPTVIGFKAFMRKQTSPGLGNTPGIEQLMAYRQHLRPVEAVRFASTSRGNYEESQQEERQSEQSPIIEEQIVSGGRLNYKQQKVLDLFNEGKTAHREIAAVMTISESEAYRILVQLDAAGYIQRRKQQVQL